MKVSVFEASSRSGWGLSLVSNQDNLTPPKMGCLSIGRPYSHMGTSHNKVKEGRTRDYLTLQGSPKILKKKERNFK